MVARPKPELDVQVCAIKTRFKPNWEKGLERLRELEAIPTQRWPFKVNFGDIDADWPDDPLAALRAVIAQMSEAWDEDDTFGTSHFRRIDNVGKRHLLVTGAIQLRTWAKDGKPLPLPHSPEANAVIWLKALGITDLIGFDEDDAYVMWAGDGDEEEQPKQLRGGR